MRRRPNCLSRSRRWGSEVFDRIAEQLSDVEYVLAAKIGPHAVNSLSRKQIVALDITATIEEALHKVSDYRDKKKLVSQRAKQSWKNSSFILLHSRISGRI